MHYQQVTRARSNKNRGAEAVPSTRGPEPTEQVPISSWGTLVTRITPSSIQASLCPRTQLCLQASQATAALAVSRWTPAWPARPALPGQTALGVGWPPSQESQSQRSDHIAEVSGVEGPGAAAGWQCLEGRRACLGPSGPGPHQFWWSRFLQLPLQLPHGIPHGFKSLSVYVNRLTNPPYRAHPGGEFPVSEALKGLSLLCPVPPSPGVLRAAPGDTAWGPFPVPLLCNTLLPFHLQGAAPSLIGIQSGESRSPPNPGHQGEESTQGWPVWDCPRPLQLLQGWD